MTVQVLAAGLVAYLSEKLGFTFYLLGILFVLMVIDYFSGMGASAIEALTILEITITDGAAGKALRAS